MQVLHVIPEIKLGGVEVTALKAARLARDKGLEYRILCLEGVAPELEKEVERLGDKVQVLERGKWNLGKYISAYFWMRRETPDAILFSLWRSVPLLLLCRMFRMRVPLYRFVHNTGFSHKLDRWFSCLAERCADRVLTDCQETKKALVDRLCETQMTVIPYVVLDGKSATGAYEKERCHAIYLGRVNPVKGIESAIQLVSLVNQGGAELHLDVFGPLEMSTEAVQGVVERYGATQWIHYKGELNPGDVGRVLSRYLFLIQLSQREGLGISVLEAMGYGTVPVVTPVGEIKNNVRDGVNGLVVYPTEDGMTETAERLCELIENKVQWQSLSQSAIHYARSYPDYLSELKRFIAESDF